MGSPLVSQLFDLARAGATHSADRQARFEPLMRALSHRTLRVVVVGEVKKGKSSFLNALLDQPALLPTAAVVATSVVFKLIYGPEARATVFFQETDDAAVPPIVIRLEDLGEYGTETGNPQNAKKVDFIAVELPHPLLKEGFVFVDTPGVGGLILMHRDIALRYLPQADVIIFILDSAEAVMSAEELQFLKSLRQLSTASLFFVQTKTDVAGSEQVHAWKQRNLEIIAEAIQQPISEIAYFLVGSELKQHANELQDESLLYESGFPRVTQYLRQVLMPQRDNLIVRRWLPSVENEFLTASTQLADRLAITSQVNTPQLKEYEERLRAADAAFKEWESVAWPAKLRRFNDEIGQLQRTIQNTLEDSLLHDGDAGLQALDQFAARCKKLADIDDNAEQFLAEWANTCADEIRRLLMLYCTQFLVHYGELTNDVAGELTHIVIPEISIALPRRRATVADPTRALREGLMSSNIMGGVAGEAAKWIGLGAGMATAVGLLSNPIGWGIAALSGVGYVATRLLAGVHGYRAARERERETALTAVGHAQAGVSRVAQRHGGRLLRDLIAEMKTEVDERLKEFHRSTRQEFSSRVQELNEARNRTKAESQAVELQLKGELAREQGFLKQAMVIRQLLEQSGNPV